MQGFLAADRKSALELFDKAEEFFKQCKENVSDTASAKPCTAAVIPTSMMQTQP